ncbi:MAG: nuclear transport factor 2 family protein [Betaproteobacteria bacterium]|nr:nuclear transport factor 2 family protein [Betaproteobacteria bacterium]
MLVDVVGIEQGRLTERGRGLPSAHTRLGHGRDGLRQYLEHVTWKRPGRLTWRPIHLFACGDFVVLHKLLPVTVIADFMRLKAQGLMAEHWCVAQPLPGPDYDPMQPSTKNLSRFSALFKIT